MKVKVKNKGSVLLIAVFAVSLLGALVMGMLQMNTEELQVMRNQIYAAGAIATSEAGLNDAFKELRSDPNWNSGFTDKAFNDDTYTVTVEGSSPDPNIISTGTTSQGFVARVKAEVTIGDSSPYIIRIDNFRINE